MEKCYFRVAKVQFVSKKTGLPTSIKEYHALPEELEGRIKRGHRILEDNPCPGNVTIEVEIGGDYDCGTLEVNWYCSQREEMGQHNPIPNDGRYPVNAGNLNLWLNKALGLIDKSQYCECQDLMVCARCKGLLEDGNMKDELNIHSFMDSKPHRVHLLCPRT